MIYLLIYTALIFWLSLVVDGKYSNPFEAWWRGIWILPAMITMIIAVIVRRIMMLKTKGAYEWY